MVSGEIFRTLILACFQHVQVRTEATFSELDTSLPSLLCRFMTPDQAGQILASIFTCLCNYNTEICGMAMAQTVVPVYTIPNTYRVQQSLWESLCWIIPGIACTSGSMLHSVQPVAPHNTPVEQPDAALGAGDSGDPGARATKSDNLQPTAALSSCKKKTDQESHRDGIPVGIPPAGSVWAPREAFQNLPTVVLADDGDPPEIQPQETSTPIKATLAPERHLSGKKLNISKIKATHLLFDMQDQQERAWRSVEAESQAAVSDRTTGKERGSGRGLPHGLPATLPNPPGGDGMPTVPSDLTPEAPRWGTKCPHDDDDDEITELPNEDEPAGPPMKKKKKKKSKDKPKDEVPVPEAQDDGARPSTSTAEPEVVAEESMPVPASSKFPAEETKVPRKKKKKKQKKKEANLEKFQLEQWEAKAKEMAKVKHRKIQPEQDFRAVRNYWKSVPAAFLETINGADHSGFLLEKLKKENNYMSKKSGHKRNLMTVEQLLSRIAKYANEPAKCLREAQAIIKSTFPMVQGMPTGDKCSLELVVRVLMDCLGKSIDCDHHEYGKEQNIGLHNVISPVAMARVTVWETHIVDGIPTTIKADHAYCPFCAYTTSNHRAVNNHVRMHFRAIMVCGWPGCYFVHMQSLRMIEHSTEVHGMARAKPAWEKGGD